MITRPYKETDQLGVIELWQEAFPEMPPHNDPVADINRKLTVQRELFIIAEQDERIIGSAMAGFDGHRGWVYYVAVRANVRRKQVGKKLMNRIEADLAKAGCTKLNLQVRSDNKEVIEFYRTLGYAIEDRISMAKHLKMD